MAGDSSGTIFISYRRDDTQGAAGRLHDHLDDHFEVFMDVDSMEPGVEFDKAIDMAVSRCDVLLALIGRHWTTSVDANGDRRLDNPDDYVVREVRQALERGIRVIPVLVDGATMPRPDELPPALKPLARRHATHLDHVTFQTQAEELVAKLQRIVAAGPAEPPSTERLPGDAVPTPAHGLTDVGPGHEPPTTPPAVLETPPSPPSGGRRRLVALAALGLLVLGAVGALILLWPDSGSNGGEGTTSTTAAPQVRDRLEPGERLNPGTFLATADGRHRLEMTTGGRLQLTTDGQVRWGEPSGPQGSWANMQATDGNFVVYPPVGDVAVWASRTGGNPGAYLRLEDRSGEGRITIYAADGTELWHRPLAGGPEPTPPDTTTETTAATTLPETTVPVTTVPVTTTP